MNNIRQNKIIVYVITLLIITIYIFSLSIHSIKDRGKIKDTLSTEIGKPDNNVQGVETEKNPNNNENNNVNGDQNNSDNGENKTGEDGEVVDNKDRIKVLQNGKTDWKELKELDIFNNSYFHDEAIIAPGIHGSYSFTVENISEKLCVYDISYSEENKYEINMEFKLKKNGKYISGNDNNWVKCNKLNVQNIQLDAKTIDVYTIEWKWIDSENDTEIGRTQGANYKLFINVNATEKEGV